MANWFAAFKVQPFLWYDQVIPQLPSGLRIFHKDDIHLTVAFLGNLDTPKIPILTDTLKSFQFSPIKLRAQKLILLPSLRHFTAVCLDFKDHQIEFEKKMDEWKNKVFQALGMPLDNRKFLPHTTIARPPRKINSEDREKIRNQCLNLTDLNIEVNLDTLALYTWADNRTLSPPHTRQFKTVFERSFS